MKNKVHAPIKIYCDVTKRYIDSRACTYCQYRKSMECIQWENMKN